MHHGSGHRSRRTPSKRSILGGGLLERARSTTLGLLGLTTAVGLAMVALAVNQTWPLIAGSPIPLPSPRHEAVGKATVASDAGRDGVDRDATRAANGSRPAPDRQGAVEKPGNGQPRGTALAPPGSPGLVVATSAPVEPRGEGQPATPNPAPAPASPAGSPPPASSAPVSTEPEPASAPPPTETAPPASASTDVPDDESSLPPWSEGRGHGYGRSRSDWDDRDHDWDDDRGWGGRDHDWGDRDREDHSHGERDD